MVQTPNLEIDKPDVSQLNKETTIGTGFDRFDESENDNVSVDINAGGTITLSSAEKLDNKLIVFTNGSGATNIDIPDGNRDLKFENASGEQVTLDTVTGGAATIVLPDGVTMNVMVKATDIVQIGVLSASYGLKSVYIPVAEMQPSTSDGCSTLTVVEETSGRPNIHVRDFVHITTAESAQFQFVFPNRWDRGTITFEASYTHVGGQTATQDGVAWGLSAVQAPDDSAWDAVFGTQVIISHDGVNADVVHRTAESAAVTVAGTLEDGGLVFFEIERVIGHTSPTPPDDLDVTARLLGVRIFWTEDNSVES